MIHVKGPYTLCRVIEVFLFCFVRFHGENLITLGYAIVKKKPRSLPRRYSSEYENLHMIVIFNYVAVFSCSRFMLANHVQVEENY